jgi:hypothetical protein
LDNKILSQLGNVDGKPLADKEVQINGQNILVLASSIVTAVPPKDGKKYRKSISKCRLKFYFYNHSNENEYSLIQSFEVSGVNLVEKGRGHSIHDWIELANLKDDDSAQIVIRINTTMMPPNFFIFDLNKTSKQFSLIQLKNASLEKISNDGKTQIVTVVNNVAPKILELKDDRLIDVSSSFPDYYKNLIPEYLKHNQVEPLLTCYKMAGMRDEFMNLVNSEKSIADTAAKNFSGSPQGKSYENRSKYLERLKDSY